MKKDELIKSIKLLLTGSTAIKSYAVIGSTAKKMQENSNTLDLSKDIDVLVICEATETQDILADHLMKGGTAQEIKKSEDGVFCRYESILYHFSGFSSDDVSSMLFSMTTDGEIESKITAFASQQRPWTVFGWHKERLAYDILSAFIIYDYNQLITQHQKMLMNNWGKIVFYAIKYNVYICKERFTYLAKNKAPTDVLLITIADIMVCIHRILTIDLLSHNNGLYKQRPDELKQFTNNLNQVYKQFPSLLKIYEENNPEYIVQTNDICDLLDSYQNYYQTNLNFNVGSTQQQKKFIKYSWISFQKSSIKYMLPLLYFLLMETTACCSLIVGWQD